METTNPTPSTVTAPELDVARALEDAALYLEHYGWCQGDMYVHTGDTLPRACALGAINFVVYNAPVFDYGIAPGTPEGRHARTVVSELADYLDDGIWRADETPAEVVWQFNDHSASTVQLVTHALRAAARRYRVLEDA